jgi:transcriptional regulator with XRE-family HTH domain
MEMMRIFASNMKKYRKKRQFSQMKLAELLNTTTSYIGEIEINRKKPSLDMVEKIAEVLGIEPFRLFLENKSEENENGDNLSADSCLERLSVGERQNLTKQLIALISNDVEAFLQPESSVGK